jgi:hypothetical protein
MEQVLYHSVSSDIFSHIYISYFNVEERHESDHLPFFARSTLERRQAFVRFNNEN